MDHNNSKQMKIAVFVSLFAALSFFIFSYAKASNESLRYLKKYSNYNAYGVENYIKVEANCLLSLNIRNNQRTIIKGKEIHSSDYVSKSKFSLENLDENRIIVRGEDGFYEVLIYTKFERPVVEYEIIDYKNPNISKKRFNKFVLISLKTQPEKNGELLKAHIRNMILSCSQ